MTNTVISQTVKLLSTQVICYDVTIQKGGSFQLDVFSTIEIQGILQLYGDLVLYLFSSSSFKRSSNNPPVTIDGCVNGTGTLSVFVPAPTTTTTTPTQYQLISYNCKSVPQINVVVSYSQTTEQCTPSYTTDPTTTSLSISISCTAAPPTTNSLSGGQIAAVVVVSIIFGVFFIVLIVALVYRWYKRREVESDTYEMRKNSGNNARE